MLGIVFGVMCLISFGFALAGGGMAGLSSAALSGASAAVTLTISLLGMMALWGGVMRVAEKTGAVGVIARIMRPFLALAFPDAAGRNAAKRRRGKKKADGGTKTSEAANPRQCSEGLGALAAAITANMLGLGNAATPLALKAMEKLRELAPAGLPDGEASDDMVTFAVLSCSPLNLLPTTLIALREAAGSANALEIIIPVWIVSAASSLFAVIAARGLRSRRAAGAARRNGGG